MNQRLDLEILGWLLVGLAALQLVPTAAALGYGERILPFVTSGAVGLFYGLPIALTARPRDRRMRTRDGFLVVSAAWVLASVFGALPYVLAGVLDPVDALFESVSGFTTTGSTVLTRIEPVPRALLLWRSLTQWVGGMGIIVVTIAILPLLRVGGMQLFQAEMPGPVTDKLTPRIADTARRLWLIYVGLTACCTTALILAGMGPFDAICHAFTTLATGGFSTRTDSIGYYGLPAVEWVVIVFMLLAGMNFALHYRIFAGRAGQVLADGELRLYLLLVGSATAAVVWLLAADGFDEPTLRVALFQVVSLVTTTGYATTDYALWPALAQFLVLPMLVVGGMAGSTGGGLKTLRLLIGLRTLRAFFLRIVRPFTVRPVRYSGRAVSEEVVSGVAVFFMAYFGLAVAAGAVVAAGGYDPLTSLSAAFTALGNVGPGLGAVGPAETFAPLPVSAKLALTFCMLAGRLEIFTLLVLFDPHFWRR